MTGWSGETAPARLTQQELAEHWRITVRTLERWRAAGIGPASLKLNGRVLYRIEDVLAFEAAYSGVPGI